MTLSAWLLVSSLLAVASVGLIVSAWVQERPPLERAIARLRRGPDRLSGSSIVRTTGGTAASSTGGTTDGGGLLGRAGGLVIRIGGVDAPYLPSGAVLRLAGRTPEIHVAWLVTAALAGFLVPLVAVGALAMQGWLPLGFGLPLIAALGGAVLGPLAVHLRLQEQVAEVRMDLRHQVSAYLDVVTMLLAGNTGHEGALEQAARAGDGRLFRELRRRMREVSAAGHSLVDALDLVGRDLGLVELRQIAATASLSAAEGAPVSRTLGAKCGTLRATLASEQESEARLRTSRLTPPLVGMSLIFMALVIYPALGFAR